MPVNDLPLTFDESLPISAAVEEIRAAIETHPVVIVAGETGSGKTTQLPKICLLAGRQRIGHTQPRRIAARSVAERMAAELSEPLGETVGYQVRFSTRTSRQTRVKVMTDGIMLAEISRDRDLRRYDTIIIDEAHERSLNIDFLLGYLKQLLPRRPDLKVIITSATIDTQRFSAHFGDAPIVEVSGRTFPVEIRYRPVRDTAAERDRDQTDAICDAVTELMGHTDGDVLVFLSGEREIRDVAEAIGGLGLRFTEVVPLYARLSAAEQHRVFAAHTGRRVVLATNVAETSLTVPGVRSVVDAGFARISRYSARTKVQRLPIEPISQASANQRAGRCGRLGPGVCIRLYSADDFESRTEFTEPEILRTNLATVILQMAEAGLGEIVNFPFVEAPDQTQVRDGMRLLRELGALDERRHAGRRRSVRLTRVGRLLARLPVDPRLGRMLVEAERQGCLREMQPLVAGLAIQDVRERPNDAQQQADAAHRRFWAPLDSDDPTPDGSDFAALLRLWEYLRRSRKQLSGNAFRRLCREEYLNFLRVREWQDLTTQLRQACRELGLNRNTEPAGMDRVHVAALAGLLSHVGLLDDREAPVKGRRTGPREYLGARGTRFAINPGSSCAKSPPPLVMAVEVVETSRLWARTVAPVTADWIEEVGEHLLKRSYSEPHWSATGGQAVASEKVSLLGIPIRTDRVVSYGPIDPVAARQILIQAALVEGRWHTRHHFYARNEAVRREVEDLEERTRRRDLVVDDQVIFAFYDARIPAGIVSVAHFDRWWRDQRLLDQTFLDLSVDDLMVEEAQGVDAKNFPDEWRTGELDLPIDYVFDPGAGRDGVTVAIELGQLNRLTAEEFGWQVPGLRGDLAAALIRTLPKALRTQLVPAPATAEMALRWLFDQGEPGDRRGPFTEALGRAVTATTGVVIPAEAWRWDAVPDHLRVGFEIVKGTEVLGAGKDLPGLQRQLAGQVTATLNRAAGALTHPGATTWEFGVLPEQVDADVLGYPGLVDRTTKVGVAVLPDLDAARRAHLRGLRRLVTLTTVDPTNWVVSRLGNQTKFALAHSPYPSVPDLLRDCRLRATEDLILAAMDPWTIRDPHAFAALGGRVRAGVAERMLAVVTTTGEILGRHQRVLTRLVALPAGPATRDISEQLANLIFDGFVAATPEPHWGRLERYLRAILTRLDGLATNPGRDAQRLETILELEDDYAELCSRCPPGPLPEDVVAVGWLLEELRVGLFAQSLGTAVPVSAKRIRSALGAIEAPR